MNVSVEVLGCSAGSPTTRGAASGYLITIEDKRVLLECGPGVVQELAGRDLIGELDAVVVSHEHFDHCGDLMALAYHRAFPRTMKPLSLYAPAAIRSTLAQMDETFGIPSLEELRQPIATQLPLHEVEIGASFEVNGIRVDTLTASHPVPTMSLRFPELSLTYTADTKLTDDLVHFAMDNVVLAEATYATAAGRDFDKHGHMSGYEVGILGRRSEARGGVRARGGGCAGARFRLSG